MGDTIDLRSIGKFDGTNFQAWKFQMKAIFIANGLTDVVNGVIKREETTTDEQRAQWDKKNAKAMVIISSTMEAAQLEFLLTCETAAEMWNKLSAVHELKSESNKLLLMTRFHEYRMKPGDGVAQHVAKIENMARHLNDIGETVSTVTIMAKILGSLPEKFNALVTAWDSVESENQTLDKLRERLIKEEARMSATDETNNALAAINLKSNKTRPKAAEKKTERSKKEIECFYCHKLGHYIKDCRKKRRDEDQGIRSKEKQKNNESNTEAAFSAEVIEKEILNLEVKDVWILDSGASRHMTHRSNWISNLQTYKDEHVSLGDGTKCKVHGRGTVYIQRLVDGQWLDGVLEDVLYVPDLNKNLFSVGACMNKNYRVVFTNNSVKLFLNNALKASGAKRNNNLFHMFFKVRSENEACVTTTTNIKNWHNRLGHVNYKYIRQMCKQGLITDSSIDNTREIEDLFCEACQYGKQHRLPFKSTTRDKPLSGELIHSDVCGKMSQESVGGSNYFVSFKDDCTAYRMVFFIKHKTDVLEKLKEFVNLVENKF
ncbi:Copia protein [Trachymyrmex cornetzi]|uniref:Copia protein n=1 Tax=Trachymyrmex cornetzi TaxID=471704 RepID=A0A151ITN2_9HYME|nr:Copia protein [Trachymyrmex cornetzi]